MPGQTLGASNHFRRAEKNPTQPKKSNEITADKPENQTELEIFNKMSQPTGQLVTQVRAASSLASSGSRPETAKKALRPGFNHERNGASA